MYSAADTPFYVFLGGGGGKSSVNLQSKVLKTIYVRVDLVKI